MNRVIIEPRPRAGILRLHGRDHPCLFACNSHIATRALFGCAAMRHSSSGFAGAIFLGRKLQISCALTYQNDIWSIYKSFPR